MISRKARGLMYATLSTSMAIVSIAGIAAPHAASAPAHFTQDLTKSTLEYSFVQAGAQNKGTFKKYTVTLDVAGDKAEKLDVVIDMTSLDTGDKERDDTLRGADLFNVAKNPQARFTSAQITKTAAGYDAVGKLTLRGVSKDVHVPFTLRMATEQGKSVATWKARRPSNVSTSVSVRGIGNRPSGWVTMSGFLTPSGWLRGPDLRRAAV